MTIRAEQTDVRAADPGDLQFVTPAQVAITVGGDLTGTGQMLVRVPLKFFVSGVRPRAVEWIGGELERLGENGATAACAWWASHSPKHALDKVVQRYLFLEPDYYESSEEPPTIPAEVFDPILLTAYGSAALVGQFVADLPADSVQVGQAYRLTLRARLTGQGDITRTWAVLDFELVRPRRSGVIVIVPCRRADEEA